MQTLFLIKLYISYILHQTTTFNQWQTFLISCISLISYIKPQRGQGAHFLGTSCISLISYIKPQLTLDSKNSRLGCISLISYIKPQHIGDVHEVVAGCISLISYIKPQRSSAPGARQGVVYLLYPTSNHNSAARPSSSEALYISYILHQTTTLTDACILLMCCISLISYIKPQLTKFIRLLGPVVYLLYPTSNHNVERQLIAKGYVVYLLYTTSNHNAISLR